MNWGGVAGAKVHEPSQHSPAACHMSSVNHCNTNPANKRQLTLHFESGTRLTTSDSTTPHRTPSHHQASALTHSLSSASSSSSPCAARRRRRNVVPRHRPHRADPLGRARPAAHHARVRPDDALHRRRPALQLPRAPAAAPVGLLRRPLLQLPLRGRPAAQPRRRPARRPVPPGAALAPDRRRRRGLGHCRHVSQLRQGGEGRLHPQWQRQPDHEDVQGAHHSALERRHRQRFCLLQQGQRAAAQRPHRAQERAPAYLHPLRQALDSSSRGRSERRPRRRTGRRGGFLQGPPGARPRGRTGSQAPAARSGAEGGHAPAVSQQPRPGARGCTFAWGAGAVRGSSGGVDAGGGVS
ncbi:hypothetical protein VFPFJ_08668 [Purpureocillium lilacinum]|uniref:Uncharacterized protein n=1 Tax=Purpureocillium lilacinum TaxID=33203 RepID=A0A179GY15_PURLI|nr:hypothetical protein VFPFJ_08668 [Purpureocillium lilacinum]OAQ82865.1 hypothetical protein VFPFJ_08668 [Purpureocillium lilacinum]